MLVDISENRTVNTDHIALIQPMLGVYEGLYHILFSNSTAWTIQVTPEDRKLILNAVKGKK